MREAMVITCELKKNFGRLIDYITKMSKDIEFVGGGVLNT